MEEEKARITALHSDHIASLLAKALDEKERALADLTLTHSQALASLQAAHDTQQQLLTEELGGKTTEQIAAMELQYEAVADQRVADLRIQLKKEMVTYLPTDLPTYQLNASPNPTHIINLPVLFLLHINPNLNQSRTYPNLSIPPFSRWSNWSRKKMNSSNVSPTTARNVNRPPKLRNSKR